MYNGWIRFTDEEIDAHVTRSSPRNYMLGKIGRDGNIKVRYVGRSDSDLAARFKQHIEEGYKFFAFQYATSPMQAFRQECQNYHKNGESSALDNKIHPDSPSRIHRVCPICQNDC